MREENWLNDYVFTIEQFFSSKECDKYIRISEEFGYEAARIAIGISISRM